MLTILALVVPFLLLNLALAVAGSVLIVQSRRRPPMPVCPDCNYDLRASPSVCPECGHQVDAAASASEAEIKRVLGISCIATVFVLVTAIGVAAAIA